MKYFPPDMGTIACPCVVSGAKPVLFVSRAGGDWQMYCDWRNHDFNEDAVLKALSVVHIMHLVDNDSTLLEIADLPIDMAAERPQLGASWQQYPDRDD